MAKAPSNIYVSGMKRRGPKWLWAEIDALWAAIKARTPIRSSTVETTQTKSGIEVDAKL